MAKNEQLDFDSMTPEDLLLRQWREVEDRRLEIESKMIALGMQIPERNSPLTVQRKPKTIVEATQLASKDLRRDITKANVVEWIERNAGWNDKVNANSVTTTLQRLRDDLEIVESVKGGKGKATIYQTPNVFIIDKLKYAALMKQPFESKGKGGGFQNFIYQIQKSVRQIDDDLWELRLSDPMLERIERYYSKHGGGGWQNRLKSIFGDFMELERKK